MKKRLLSLFAVSAFAWAAAVAEDFTVGPFTYTVGEDATTVILSKAESKDDSGAKITSYEVPATVQDANGQTYTVTVIGREAFKWSNATKITLPDCITEIGYGAFSSSSSLAEMNMPSSLTTIGDYAFSSLALTSVNLPASLKTIGGSAFFTCKQLASITFNEGLESIGVSCFYGCQSLKSVVLPSSLTTLGAKAFLRCQGLETASLSPAMTTLEDGTFNDCPLLNSISIPDGITTIGDEVFLGCTSLTSLTIPASVTEIGTSLTAKTGVSSITVDPANTAFTVDGGVLYEANKKVLYAVPQTGLTSVTVDPACIGIKGGAFWGSKVTDVVIPDGFLAFDDYAFCQSELTNINFPASTLMIGEQAFASSKITNGELPEGLTAIYDGSFASCLGLQKVTIPAGVKVIYNHAFHSCTNITSFTCKGTEAPEIDDVYDEYDSPFYKIAKTVPVYVPYGSVASYNNEGWDSFLTVTELAAPALTLQSAAPADGTVLGKYANMTVDLVFSEEVSIAEKSPAVKLLVGNEATGSEIEPDDAWYATAVSGDKNAVRIWASDYDGYTQYFSTKEDEVYYLVIPAGVVKNAAGATNERIVIVWNGPQSTPAPTPKFEPTATAPAQDEEISSKYAEMAFRFTFPEDFTILDYGPDATFTQTIGSAVTKIEPDLYWKAQKEAGNVLYIWASDYDYYLQSYNVKDDATYTFTLPAGVVKSESGVTNEEYVLTFSGKKSTSSVDVTVVDEVVARYDINGCPVGPDYKGFVIERKASGRIVKQISK